MGTSSDVLFFLVLVLAGCGSAYHVFVSEAGIRSRAFVAVVYAGSWLLEWADPKTAYCLITQIVLTIYIVFHFQHLE